MADLFGPFSDSELYYEADSVRNLLTGQGHTVTGSDDVIAGADGTLTGVRSVLLSLDGDPHSETRDGALILWGDFYYNGTLLEGGALALDELSDVALTSPVTVGQILGYQGSPPMWTNIDNTAVARSVGITIDGGGSVITTGVKGFIEVPFSGTITAARAFSTDASVTSGSIVVDVWKDTYANYPPTNADSITASAPVTISTATKSQDTTLTGWTTTITAGDILGFNVDSVTDLTRVTISLTITPS